ncbi:precorrin-8X methylmutase, partial [Pseudomonas aeruginosa]|uniref:precorrin-8X methylmutase n=2 Tax=Pseudomonas aeruginosa TaxID=287 RepID=UPI0021562A1D
MIDYIRDGQAIYRQSFATIRAEANLAGIPADLEKLAVRVIHACGMVDVVDDLRFSPGAGAAGRGARPSPAPGGGRRAPPRRSARTGRAAGPARPRSAPAIAAGADRGCGYGSRR